MRAHGEIGIAAARSGAQIESPQVPRADDLVADDVPFRERSAAMRARVVEREEPRARMTECQLRLADCDELGSSDRKIVRGTDIDEVRQALSCGAARRISGGTATNAHPTRAGDECASSTSDCLPV